MSPLQFVVSMVWPHMSLKLSYRLLDVWQEKLLWLSLPSRFIQSGHAVQELWWEGGDPSNCAKHFNIVSDLQDKMTFCLQLELSEAIHDCLISL